MSKNDEKNFVKHDFVIKIISPNIELKKFISNANNDEIVKELIKISSPKADQKTIFIWPEGMFPSIYLSEIKKYKNFFSQSFSNLH